jgi:hypothetical protein
MDGTRKLRLGCLQKRFALAVEQLKEIAVLRDSSTNPVEFERELGVRLPGAAPRKWGRGRNTKPTFTIESGHFACSAFPELGELL